MRLLRLCWCHLYGYYLTMTNKLRLLFTASRPFSWVNTAFPFAAAYLLAGGQVNVFFAITTLFFLIPYNLLMYGVNDVYDYDSDILNPRKGGVEGAKIPKPYHRLVLWSSGLACLPFVLYLFVNGTPTTNLMLIALVADVVLYSLPPIRLKERAFLDSVCSSIHFVGPALFGAVVAGQSNNLAPALWALFAWGLASHMFGAIQDIEPDRAAGIKSIATALGHRLTTYLSVGLYGVAIAVSASYLTSGALLFATILAMYPVNVIWSHRTQSYNTGWKRWMWLNLATGFVFTQLVLWQLVMTGR